MRPRQLLLLATICGCAPPAATREAAAPLIQWSEVAAQPVPLPDFRVPYGRDSLQFGDLRVPAGAGPHPVAVLIHGGCWRAAYGLDYMSSAAAALTAAGVATWTPEFRRVGDVGGGWPGTFQDVSGAVAHLGPLAHVYHLDLERVVLVGHSAGGHLALWAAAQHPFRRNSTTGAPMPRPRGVVTLAGITDLRAYAGPTGCNAAVPLLLGGSPDEVPGRYASVSPIERVPLGVPSRLVQGARDPIVPVAQATAFAERARQAGDDARVLLLEHAGHFELVVPSSSAWREVQAQVLELLARRR